ncbi:hypothetical protein BDZ45DRAFT_793056 [Acephala macrosclerotiorum]|nr:hypothetical protein BDZ45DRAFT_793056 [Acephala macrosclerotiorum]
MAPALVRYDNLGGLTEDEFAALGDGANIAYMAFSKQRASNIHRLLQFYEASDNKFFLDKIRTIMQDARSNGGALLDLVDQGFIEADLLRIAYFLYGGQNLSKKEALKLREEALARGGANAQPRRISFRTYIELEHGFVFLYYGIVHQFSIDGQHQTEDPSDIVRGAKKHVCDIFRRGATTNKAWIKNIDVKFELTRALYEIKIFLGAFETKANKILEDAKKGVPRPYQDVTTEKFALVVLDKGLDFFRKKTRLGLLKELEEELEELGINHDDLVSLTRKCLHQGLFRGQA